ncbi:hypothetical protein [Rhodovulum adriaticum]|uniref:Pimeloyl-ACP methyl ester carboxylesterase n=1 Tax=Rhodovulum adriaticum TaxID=35804 RepID=A0A4R2NV07_RHOAD|nr:hypothetical protein [Rhodovulum adriaticum]MBK1636892.1 hypothetical protein [Rhodovulum adriaticum]TCP25364.1 hypothetical protein EV656_103113 [Rhodovulum adriaticum]
MEMIGWGAGLEAGDPEHLIVFVSGYLYPNFKEFHFLKFAAPFQQTKLFLRDDSPHQFRHGIPGVTESEEENVEFLRYMIAKIGAKRVTIVSGSVGTHPAVLWGHWIGIDDMYLVGPVTDMAAVLQTDRATHPQFTGLFEQGKQQIDAGYPYSNLRPMMEAHSDRVASIDIYYGQNDPVDVAQAANIADLPHVRSTVYYQGDHFRVPAFALRRDPDIAARINAPVIERPADQRRAGGFAPLDLGYAMLQLEGCSA